MSTQRKVIDDVYHLEAVLRQLLLYIMCNGFLKKDNGGEKDVS